jgi:hypothetical protein
MIPTFATISQFRSLSSIHHCNRVRLEVFVERPELRHVSQYSLDDFFLSALNSPRIRRTSIHPESHAHAHPTTESTIHQMSKQSTRTTKSSRSTSRADPRRTLAESETTWTAASHAGSTSSGT